MFNKILFIIMLFALNIEALSIEANESVYVFHVNPLVYKDGSGPLAELLKEGSSKIRIKIRPSGRVRSEYISKDILAMGTVKSFNFKKTGHYFIPVMKVIYGIYSREIDPNKRTRIGLMRGLKHLKSDIKKAYPNSTMVFADSIDQLKKMFKLGRIEGYLADYSSSNKDIKFKLLPGFYIPIGLASKSFNRLKKFEASYQKSYARGRFFNILEKYFGKETAGMYMLKESEVKITKLY